MSGALRLVEDAARLLAGLDVVFVGGAVLGLYLPARVQEEVRATEDVDCVVSVSYMGLANLERQLAQRGLSQSHNLPTDPICRWRDANGAVIDVMPAEPTVLGFSNAWYVHGVREAQAVELPDGQTVRIFPVLLYLASKVDAYYGRGETDPWLSQDLEDIVTLLDGCEDLEAKIAATEGDLRRVLLTFFRDLFEHPNFEELVLGMAPRPDANRARAHAVQRTVVRLARLD